VQERESAPMEGILAGDSRFGGVVWLCVPGLLIAVRSKRSVLRVEGRRDDVRLPC